MSQVGSQPINESTPPRVAGIVVAGGLGKRMGSPTPKQFLSLAGKPMLLHSLEIFDRHPGVDVLCVVADPAYHTVFQREAPWTSLAKPLILAEAGRERADSVRSGLAAMRGRADIVLIHDGARPLVTAAMIDATLAEARRGRGAITARPVSDTVKRSADGGRIAETLDRRHLWLAETPQAFPFELIWRAHELARERGVSVTDDAQAVEMLGGEVVLCPAATPNAKVTAPEDLAVAEALMQARWEAERR
jgi:2-C-methyl-D-erythritol 4-phosphate cytidylyltransferase